MPMSHLPLVNDQQFLLERPKTGVDSGGLLMEEPSPKLIKLLTNIYGSFHASSGREFLIADSISTSESLPAGGHKGENRCAPGAF